MKNPGSLVISLDFELIWGVFDKVELFDKVDYFNNTRDVIPVILSLFKEYNVHGTWATVGMLFNNDFEEWKKNTPDSIPEYKNEKLSAYKYGKGKQTIGLESYFFAPDLIQLIRNSPNQEIGTHTYSHYYCNENGQNSEHFRSDLEQSIELAKKFGIDLKSLVFPRNQINKEYLKVCSELGITTVRSNPVNWYWKNTESDNLASKIFRTGDAYFGKLDKLYKINEVKKGKNGVIEQKASRLLRPYTNNYLLNRLKISRIKSEMLYAAKNGYIYHLWWHPHNFGNNPTENLRDLEELLKYFKHCKEKYGFLSLTMSEIAEIAAN